MNRGYFILSILFFIFLTNVHELHDIPINEQNTDLLYPRYIYIYIYIEFYTMYQHREIYFIGVLQDVSTDYEEFFLK